MIEKLLYVMTFLALGWVLFSSTHSEEPADPACANSGTAWSMTKAIVRQHMGHPLSVRFPDPFASSGAKGIDFRYLGDCRHEIIAFADAFYRRNDPTRRYFLIELSYHGQLGWRLDEIYVNDPRSSI